MTAPVLPRHGTWLLLAGLGLTAVGLALEPQNPPTNPPPTAQAVPLVNGYGTADSNGSMIAVTGMDFTGASLLYLVDTQTKHLSVYQATGGSEATSRIRWIGARNIELDLAVDGYNDKSEFSFKALEEKFKRGEVPDGR
ncbi:MAG: hypothetical protein FJ299_12650 [Planctomycetes bacterium]|nr:hypothetical protein [Planctomycetota bacterium]